MSWSFNFQASSAIGLFGVRERFNHRAAEEQNQIIAAQISCAGLAVEKLFEQLHGEPHSNTYAKLHVNAVGHVYQVGTSPSFITVSVTYESQSAEREAQEPRK